MKALLITSLLLLASPLLHAQSRSSRDKQQLLGPVRTVRVEAVLTTNGLTGPRVSVFTEVYDEKGNVLHQEVFNRDGSLKWAYGWGHAYDSQGREVKTFYYNSQGALTNTGVSIYDEKGRVTETTQVNPDGSINHIKSFSYDDKRGKVHETFRSPEGTPRSEVTRTYDENGRLTEEVFLGADGSLHHRNTFTYDGHGNQTGSILFKSDGTVSPWFRKSLSYDDRGNVKEAVNYLSNNSIGSKETFSYEFDEHGNWIKRKTSREVFNAGSSSSESEVTYRTITYF
jgi:hypothetical protein